MITEADRQEIRQLAESGDDAAKAALAALAKDAPPESETSVPKESEVGTEEKPKETPEEKPAESEEKPKVDQAQEKPDDQKRERIHPAQRRIDRDKREMALRMQRMEQQNAELLKALQELKTPRSTEKTETDDLNKLLADPNAYLAERDKRVLEQARKFFSEESKKTTEQAIRKQIENDKALKIIDSIDGYDDRRDSDKILRMTADYLNDVYGTSDYDEEEIENMLLDQPAKMASVMKKAWDKSRALSDQAKADKKAATAAPAGTGKAGSSKAPSLTDLNAELAKANNRGDRKAADEILGKIAEQLGEKK